MNTADTAQRTDVDVEPLTGKFDHKHRCLVWAGQYAADWEILAYHQEDPGKPVSLTGTCSMNMCAPLRLKRFDALPKSGLMSLKTSAWRQ